MNDNIQKQTKIKKHKMPVYKPDVEKFEKLIINNCRPCTEHEGVYSCTFVCTSVTYCTIALLRNFIRIQCLKTNARGANTPAAIHRDRNCLYN